LKILIIDDDEDLRNLLSHYLKQEWPHAVIEKFDPLAREMPDASFPLGTYDAIILDYMLGSGDGLEWLHELKRRTHCPPVLFLTAAGNEVIAVRAMKAGADDYQRKQDLTREKLIASIRDLTYDKSETTVSVALAARMNAHNLGARIRIPGIRVLRLIGEGGMSRVYLASRQGDDEPLIVKILRSEVTEDNTAVARFMAEFDLIERIGSRHVARIHGHGVSEGLAYLVMEFFDGGDLKERLGGKALPPEDSLRIFRELMFALGDIHERGIVHRDLKPQNLMFRADGSLAIVDFGIAKHVDSASRTGHDEVLGTPHYMSPEQARGLTLDMRTDIYSAGVLLFQMFAGRHLFDGETAIEVALRHVDTLPPPLPDDLAQYQCLLDKLLEKDRNARFRNADEVIGFLSRKFGHAGAPIGAESAAGSQ